MANEHSLAAAADFHREKRSQRRQIFTLLILGWLTCLLILQVHHPAGTSIVASFGDLNVVWARFSERILAPFTNPEIFNFGLDALGWIIGATATILVALVFTGRNPMGMANQAQVMALDELLELLTFLVGIAAGATMWMALHNVFFLSADPDSGPKFFLTLLCLMLTIFSVARQRDAAVQREIDEFHLSTAMRLHTRRWERMWGLSSKHQIPTTPHKTIRLVLWWAGSGLVFTFFPMLVHSSFSPLLLALSLVALIVLAVATAALVAAAVSLYRSNPHPGVGLGYSLVLLTLVTLAVISPLTVAALQNDRVLHSLMGYFLWLTPSLLLVLRKPQSVHMSTMEFKMAARPKYKVASALISCFDGARESAYWTELRLESHRQSRYETKLARFEAEFATDLQDETGP